MLSRTFLRLYSAVSKRKRFYKDVSLSKIDGPCSEIRLDGRIVKTPMGNVLRLDNEPLAVAIAQEWECQKDWIRPNRMHLTSLTMTALDNPSGYGKEKFIDDIVRVFETDTILFLAEDSDSLAKLQSERWGQVIDWAKAHLRIEVKPSSDLVCPVITKESRDRLVQFLSIYNESALRGLLFASDTLKSLILALAAIQGRLSVEEAVKLSALEQEFQTEQWGRVEWAHDVEYQDSCGRLAAAVLFVHLNTTTNQVVRERTEVVKEKA